MCRKTFIIFAIATLYMTASAQYVSKVWVADKGDGTYQNPILHADYSDPDVIRVGDDFYMVSSSFEDIPGLPILHSKDMVSWSIAGHALKQQKPLDYFDIPRHGQGVWAPSLRFHKGEFYCYFPDPDFGIYLTKATNPAGPWSEPLLVQGGKGLIDPCPFWDDDGEAYLVHAFAGSRAGIKSILVIKKLSVDGTRVLDDGVIVYDGHEEDPTVEGPKFYKRNGYYYLFAPAGGVSTGWQVVLRSKNIYGPYERKLVMDQGNTNINGPHQGAWVNTQTGEDWFFHFQDKGLYGRVVHLQPMKWINDWPVIGIDRNGDGKGEPVLQFKKPNVGKTYPIISPAESDDFSKTRLGLQWQWMANSQPTWAFIDATKNALKMYSQKIPDSAKNLWQVPNVLQQKFPAESFRASVRLSFNPNEKIQHEKAGLAIMGLNYANLALKKQAEGIYLVYGECIEAGKGKEEKETAILKWEGNEIYLKVTVSKGGICVFSYSSDGKKFIPMASPFTAVAGLWKGAKIGLFCTRETSINDSGWADFKAFSIEPMAD